MLTREVLGAAAWGGITAKLHGASSLSRHLHARRADTGQSRTGRSGGGVAAIHLEVRRITQPPNQLPTHHWDEQVQAGLQGLGEAAKPLDHTGGLLRDHPASQMVGRQAWIEGSVSVVSLGMGGQGRVEAEREACMGGGEHVGCGRSALHDHPAWVIGSNGGIGQGQKAPGQGRAGQALLTGRRC